MWPINKRLYSKLCDQTHHSVKIEVQEDIWHHIVLQVVAQPITEMREVIADAVRAQVRRKSS